MWLDRRVGKQADSSFRSRLAFMFHTLLALLFPFPPSPLTVEIKQKHLWLSLLERLVMKVLLSSKIEALLLWLLV